MPGNFHYPPEDDIGETHFRFDDALVDRSELPSEVTDALIEELERTAKECEGPSFDGPFDSPEDDIPDYCTRNGLRRGNPGKLG